MRRVGLAILAVLLCAAPALAQNSEMENFTAGANQMAEAQREVTQRNIDIATQALKAKDYAKARKYAQPVTRADPKRIEAWLMLGTAQLGLQDWKRARSTYAAALRITPGHAEARAGLGIAMARTNDPQARTQLAWLDAKARECGGCGQAVQLAKFKAEVETAIAEAARPPGLAPPVT
jgi:cytochrome c-type biogenesis protein CcmH/NrfG